jgi:beta-lactamase class A
MSSVGKWAAASRGALSALRLLLLVAALGVAPAAAQAQPITTNEAVARLFQEEIDPAWFDASFLAQVPVEQITTIVESFLAEFGPLVAVTGSGGDLVTRFERAEMRTQITLDDTGRIIGLFFGPAVPVDAVLADLVAEIAALPGSMSVLVATDGEAVAAHQPDMPLGVGSAFKLAILAALADEVAAGRMAWDDVVPLDPAWRSLPTGILQSWPEGTPLTVATLANLMISISDNTATDALMRILGRERVEQESPRNAPLLTTGELFRLKMRGNEEIAAEFIAADEEARRAILADIAALPLPTADRLVLRPMLEIEWFFTASELCALLERVAGNPAFDINPGVANPGNWAEIAFKGGSEPGVLNLSTLVTAADGRRHCIVATWNDTAALEDARMFSLYAGLLAAVAGDGG